MAYCSRDDRSGSLGPDRYKAETGTWAHKAEGPCPCGVEHAPDPRPERRPSKPRGRVERRYVYQAADGSPLFRVVRMRLPDGDKSFYQQRWRSDMGDFQGGLEGLKPVLYHLPELLAAEPSETVYIVEGEKDVENLEALGLVATSNPMGAEKWHDHYSDALRGRRCVVVQDNDDPGRRHARKVARSLDGKAASVRILELPGLAEHGDASDWIAAGGTADRLRELAEAAPEWERQGEAEENDRPPMIVITPNESEVAAQALAALAARDPNLYVLAGRLATVVDRGEPPRGVEFRDAPPPRVQPLEAISLRGRITACATLLKVRKNRDGEDVAAHAHPPEWLAPMVHKGPEFPGVRPLEGVILAPTLRPDGSILDQPGYDPSTRLFYRPTIPFPEIPAEPTRAEALAAVALLLDLVCDFPFRSEADRVLWLAALLTVLARASFRGPAPLFGFDGNCPGAGKTLLADSIAAVAMGFRSPKMAFPAGRNGEEEMEKRITSIAMAGSRMALLDNVADPIGGDALCAAVTSTEWEGRILGRNEMARLPLHTVWFASGNNLAPRGDMLRRVLFARIEADVENPEERGGFKYPDLIGRILADRGRLVAAGLTILRAYHVAGRPSAVKPLGSFEDWSQTVADAVAWATGVDPTAVRAYTKADDQDSAARTALVTGWAELPNAERGLTVAEAYKILKAPGHDDRFATLRAALAELSNDGDLPKPRSLAKHLGSLKGRVVAGLRLMGKPDRKDVMAWRVETTAGFAGFVPALDSDQSRHLNAGDAKALDITAGFAGFDSRPSREGDIGSSHVFPPCGPETDPAQPAKPAFDPMKAILMPGDRPF